MKSVLLVKAAKVNAVNNMDNYCLVPNPNPNRAAQRPVKFKTDIENPTAANSYDQLCVIASSCVRFTIIVFFSLCLYIIYVFCDNGRMQMWSSEAWWNLNPHDLTDRIVFAMSFSPDYTLHVVAVAPYET